MLCKRRHFTRERARAREENIDILYRNESNCIIILPWMSMLLNCMRPFCDGSFIRRHRYVAVWICANILSFESSMYSIVVADAHFPKSLQWIQCIIGNTSNAIIIEAMSFVQSHFLDQTNALSVQLRTSAQIRTSNYFVALKTRLQINTWYIQRCHAVWYIEIGFIRSMCCWHCVATNTNLTFSFMFSWDLYQVLCRHLHHSFLLRWLPRWMTSVPFIRKLKFMAFDAFTCTRI